MVLRKEKDFPTLSAVFFMLWGIFLQHNGGQDGNHKKSCLGQASASGMKGSLHSTGWVDIKERKKE